MMKTITFVRLRSALALWCVIGMLGVSGCGGNSPAYVSRPSTTGGTAATGAAQASTAPTGGRAATDAEQTTTAPTGGTAGSVTSQAGGSIQSDSSGGAATTGFRGSQCPNQVALTA